MKMWKFNRNKKILQLGLKFREPRKTVVRIHYIATQMNKSKAALPSKHG